MRERASLSRARGVYRARSVSRCATVCVLLPLTLCGEKELAKLSLFFALPSASVRDATQGDASCGPRGGQEREAHEASLGSGSGAAAR